MTRIAANLHVFQPGTILVEVPDTGELIMFSIFIPQNRLLRMGLVALVILSIALVIGISITQAAVMNPKPPVVVPDEPTDDGLCDYGRNPEKLWGDNPDGHPFERAFCDGIVGPDDPPPHPLDSPENEHKYCDEVPECWAYGL
jgi:hypothetical protein